MKDEQYINNMFHWPSNFNIYPQKKDEALWAEAFGWKWFGCQDGLKGNSTLHSHKRTAVPSLQKSNAWSFTVCITIIRTQEPWYFFTSVLHLHERIIEEQKFDNWQTSNIKPKKGKKVELKCYLTWSSLKPLKGLHTAVWQKGMAHNTESQSRCHLTQGEHQPHKSSTPWKPPRDHQDRNMVVNL